MRRFIVLLCVLSLASCGPRAGTVHPDNVDGGQTRVTGEGNAHSSYDPLPVVVLTPHSQGSSQPRAGNSPQNIGWHVYNNKKFGVSLEYPADWTVENDDPSDFLDIHLSNNVQSTNPGASGMGWSSGMQAMELQVGHEKDAHQDFDSFVATSLLEGGMGNFGGPSSLFPLEGIQARKIQDSGWDSGVSGPGYYLEQDPGHYTFIFTGSYSGDYRLQERIIRSIRFSAPSK